MNKCQYLSEESRVRIILTIQRHANEVMTWPDVLRLAAEIVPIVNIAIAGAIKSDRNKLLRSSNN